MRNLLISGLLFCGCLFFAFMTFACLLTAGNEHADHPTLTRIVLSFEGVDDSDAIETAHATLRARLEAVDASRIEVEPLGSHAVMLTYSPAAKDQATDAEAGLRLKRRGCLRFLVRPESERLVDSTLAKERQKLDVWRSSHAGESLERFHALAQNAGGPVSGLHWCFPRRSAAEPADNVPLIPLVEPKPEWSFVTRDLASVSRSLDDLGYPGVEFELTEARAAAFGEFTASIVDQEMAVVLDCEILTLATVASKLAGQGVITGGRTGFTNAEVDELITTLRAGELPAEPLLVSTDHVAKLGSGGLIAVYVMAAISFLLFLACLVFGVRRLRRSSSGPPDSSASDGGDWSSRAATG